MLHKLYNEFCHRQNAPQKAGGYGLLQKDVVIFSKYLIFEIRRQYLLKVYETPNKPNQVRLWRGQLEVSVREKTARQVQQCLDKWYRQKAKQIFAERLNWLLPQTFWVTTIPHIRLRTMETRWGSCSVQGSLCLNPHLIKAPKECIDYVILHELCHFAEHNHSERFYRLMGQVMPQWKEVKTRLDKG